MFKAVPKPFTPGGHFPESQAKPTIWGVWSGPRFTADGTVMLPPRQLIPANRFSAAAIGSPAWCKAARAQLGLTQLQLARTLGIGYTTLCAYEQGRYSPKRDTCEAILCLIASARS